jgi:hypothetical protein
MQNCQAHQAPYGNKYVLDTNGNCVMVDMNGNAIPASVPKVQTQYVYLPATATSTVSSLTTSFSTFYANNPTLSLALLAGAAWFFLKKK